MNKKIIAFITLVFVLIIALISLKPRLVYEKNNNKICLATDFKDINYFAFLEHRTQKEIYDELCDLGVTAIATGEYNIVSDNDVVPGGLELLDGGSVSGFKTGQLILSIASNYEYKEALVNYLSKKYPTSVMRYESNCIYVALPVSMEEVATTFYLPDFHGLDFARKNNIPVVFRLGASGGVDGAMVASYMEDIIAFCPNIFSVCVNGVVVPAYPDVKPVAEELKRHNISLSLIEFVKQIGTSNFAKEMSPFVLQLHSLTKDEIISRNIAKSTMLDRYARAVYERSIRIILMHPYDLQMANKFGDFKSDLTATRRAILNHGFEMGLPLGFPDVRASFLSAIAIAMFFALSLFYFVSFFAERETIDFRLLAIAIALALAVALAIYKSALAAKCFGGLCAGLGATVATLVALDVKEEHVFKKYLLAILFVFAGGTAIAAFYGTTEAIVRTAPFSGVKLTLLLPILLVFAHDICKRVHPETPAEIVTRPALWGELILLGIVLLALLVMAIRSGNVEEVSSFEMTFRGLLERVFLVRPRTKEFLLGYPAVILYYYIAKNNFVPQYREVLRLAGCIAFGSAFNTFCHFHTPYCMTIVRVANGMCLGAILGIVAVFALKFILKFAKKYINEI